MLMVEIKLRTHLEVDLVVEVVCKCIYELKKCVPTASNIANANVLSKCSCFTIINIQWQRGNDHLNAPYRTVCASLKGVVGLGRWLYLYTQSALEHVM